MQQSTPQQKAFSFLQGGGEMGELTRNFDWAQSSIGTPHMWPQALRTTVGLLLHSAFPMLLFWGRKSMITFYNDAFLPSLGTNGKHPGLGKPAKEVWSDIWTYIGPLLYQVMETGEPVYFEDQLVPFYRNGRTEDIYWTFSYSPAYDDDGTVNGVFVTCTETTQKVQNLKKVEETKDLLQAVFDASPNALSVYETLYDKEGKIEDFRILMINPFALQTIGRSDVVGTRYLEAFPQVKETGIFDEFKKVATTSVTADFEKWYQGEGMKHWFRIIIIKVGELLMVTTEDITGRKQAEEAIKESQQQLLSSFNDSPVGLAIISGNELTFTMANAFYARLAGRTPEDLIGKTLLEAMPELAGQGFDDRLRTVLETGIPIGSKEALVEIFSNGCPTKIYIDYTYQPQRDAKGNIIAILVVVIDITSQVLARKAVEESEARLDLLSNTVPAMIFYLDSEQRYQSYNKKFIQWFGEDAKKAIGQTVREFIGDEAYQRVAPHLSKAYAGNQERYELESPSRLNEARWLSIVYTPHKNEEGIVLGVIAHVTDITQSKLAEISLRQSEARFRALIEEAPVATCLFVGKEMRIEVANDTMLGYWGKPASILGLPLEEAVPELKGQPFLDILSNVLLTGKTHTAKATPAELKVNDVLGTYYFDFTCKPLFDADGKAYGIMDMAVDVTDQVRARHQIEEVVAQRTEELAEANLLLKQNNRELEQFAYVASHDLQEPLRKVTTFTEMLKKHLGEVDEKSLNFFNKISSSTLRMMQLIHDVLDFSKLSNQRQVFEKVDMGALLNHLISDFELVVEQKGAVINYKNLPTVTANPLQMRQLFGNLLSNSLKFTKERISPVISIFSQPLSSEEKALHKELLPEIDYCNITVEDNGIGFSEEHAEKIFNIFQRLHGRSEYAGTGIGLALCKKIVQNHHGEIWATSQEGVGATFHIILPCPQNTDAST